jgi:hypothetical protein
MNTERITQLRQIIIDRQSQFDWFNFLGGENFWVASGGSERGKSGKHCAWEDAAQEYMDDIKKGNCGTTACVAGLTCAIWSDVEQVGMHCKHLISTPVFYMEAKNILGLTEGQAGFLFYPTNGTEELGGTRYILGELEAKNFRDDIDASIIVNEAVARIDWLLAGKNPCKYTDSDSPLYAKYSYLYEGEEDDDE